jgi:glycosyltransferase involved in cell wall biosynthesis
MKSTNGVERVLSQRLSLLAESGEFDVYLITYNQYGAPFSFSISDKVHYVDLATRFLNGCTYHGWFQYLDRFISKIKYKQAVRSCFTSIDPDVITCVDIHFADLEVVLGLSINAVKVVECHCGLSAYYDDLNKYTYDRRNKERKIKDKLIDSVRKFDRIVVMTEAERKDWGGGDKVVCIPNMLVSYPECLSEHSVTHHRVISVGRYAYQKGYDLLIEAWKLIQEKYSDWTLEIYGSHDGDMGNFEQLQQMVDIYKMSNVYLHQTTNDVYSKYAENDFYVMSSRFESFGLVLIEAMSCGLPVISFDCLFGPRSIVDDGKTGILVPPTDVKKLAESICYMIEHPDERIRMGQKAREVVTKYKPETIISIWRNFYQSL